MRKSNMLFKVCVLVFALSVMFTGCNKSDEEKYDADENTIFVNADSSVVSTIIDTLDEEYYDDRELKDYIVSEIEIYNYEVLAEAVSLVKFDSNDDEVKVIMKYLAAEHYYKFNEEELYIGSVWAAMNDNYMFETDFVDYKKLEDVALAVALTNTSANVLIMEPAEETVIKLPGRVTYISSHVEEIDKKTVQIPANCRSYVIYE